MTTTEPAGTLAPPPDQGRPSAAAVTLTLAELTRSFAGRRVLGPLTLALDAGALAVVCGPNGAGKTTLLRVAAGLLTPTSGARACAGPALYLRPGAGARHALTVRQALRQTAALAGTSVATVDEACHLAGLYPLREQHVGGLSDGQRARLTMVLAVAAAPALACLDEPTAHLDPAGVDQIRAVLRLLIDRGTTALLTSHSPGDFRDRADATLCLHAGLLRESPW